VVCFKAEFWRATRKKWEKQGMAFFIREFSELNEL
jgi:hypothetical protein